MLRIKNKNKFIYFTKINQQKIKVRIQNYKIPDKSKLIQYKFNMVSTDMGSCAR